MENQYTLSCEHDIKITISDTKKGITKILKPSDYTLKGNTLILKKSVKDYLKLIK